MASRLLRKESLSRLYISSWKVSCDKETINRAAQHSNMKKVCVAHPRDLETDALHLADSAEIVLNGIETGVTAPGARVRIGVTIIQRLGLV